MTDIYSAKQKTIIDTPLFLFECRFKTGLVERWSTHRVTHDGALYRARILDHNMSGIKSSLDDGADGAARVSLTLANADSYFSEIEWNTGWKGARLTVTFAFFDLARDVATTGSQVVFQGLGSAPDEITESTLRVTFANRLNLTRVGVPEIRIQKRCPWMFPSTEAQRQEALNGGAGAFSPFYHCGYSAGMEGGAGNLQTSGQCFESCSFTRDSCIERGMFDKDSEGQVTRAFGGIEFVPSTILVRSYGEKGTHLAPVSDNDAINNDIVPLVYGTAWYAPPLVFARNDGNLTRLEVLLSSGEISGVIKVLVNDIEIPQAVTGANMTSTGWYDLFASGTRTGGFNPSFTSASGEPAGDPYGSMAALAVVVPTHIATGQTMPRIQVLLQGAKLARYDSDGQALARSFTNNPSWILCDVLKRSGWADSELDLPSFARTASYCSEPLTTTDVNGNSCAVPRYECNLVLKRRRSAADVIRGIRNGSALFLCYDSGGRLGVRAESSLAIQQSEKPATSNSVAQLNDGWPAYEFSDGSASFSGILRKDTGAPHLRFWSRPASDSPNRLSVEFQDEFNEYQQDSLSLVDVDDAVLSSQEVAATMTALGLANFDQAARMARLQLNKSIQGNLYVEFGTSVRGFGLAPGDIIALTYEKEGLNRQPFRIVRIAPGLNYRTAVITAQLHQDAWYTGNGASASSRRQPAFGIGIPRPLLGATIDSHGDPQFSVTETVRQTADGSPSIALTIGFSAPSHPVPTAIGIPLLSLSPTVIDGGTLPGGQTLYYAVSAIDKDGSESALSFVVKATTPTANPANTVRLSGLSFSPKTVSFHVYRGSTPSQLRRIASNVPLDDHYDDAGSSVDEIAGPPDENYDHANFYWRFEVQPEVPVTSASANTIANGSLTMLANENRGSIVRITGGAGKGQERLVGANTATELTVSPSWDIAPDSTSSFVIAEPSWRFGSLTKVGPAEFDVPNRAGASVHILGRSANTHDQECAVELSPLTRWRLSGTAGSGDTAVPPQPLFGFVPSGKGTVELVGVGFQDVANTQSITSGTLTLFYWNELNNGVPPALTAEIDDTATVVTLSSAGPVIGDLLQIEKEILSIDEIADDGLTCTVTRGAYHSAAAHHDLQTAALLLSRRTYVVPFARGFFGSPASGSYNYPVFLPDVRVGAAALFVTNDWGNSPTSTYAFTGNVESGVRTLSGGQFSIQLEGVIARQTGAAPALVVEDGHSVRDISAILREPSVGGDIQLLVKMNDVDYCYLTITAGSTLSNVIDGFGLPPLQAKAQLSLDVLSVPQDPALFPGRDLTVTIRL